MSIFTFFAQQASKIDPGSVGVPRVGNADALLNGILNTAYMVAGVVCVIIIVIAGYFYTTSSGDPASTKRARMAIIGAVVGLVVIMMAFVITQFVIGRF